MNQARKSPVIDVIQLRDSEETIKNARRGTTHEYGVGALKSTREGLSSAETRGLQRLGRSAFGLGTPRGYA